MTNTATYTKKRPTYPAYKNSGIEWLGEIPEGWEVLRLRFRAKINPSRSEINNLSESFIVSFIPMESVHEYGGLTLDQIRRITEVSAGYTYFIDGDVITAKITPCFENGKGAIAEDLVNGIGFGTTELHVLRPRTSLNSRFLFYVTISQPFRNLGIAEMYGAGGQKRVPEDFVKDFRQPIPPLPEQRAIASFLDRETVRIDGLIEKKQRQIELLQEKRAALISHAVTKGVYGMMNDECGMMNKDEGTHHSSLSTPHFKDSGIEWLGEIPEHWQILRLKYIANAKFSNVDKHSIEGEEPVRLCNYVDAYYNDYIHDGLDFMKATATRAEIRRFSVTSGDVIITKDSEAWDDIAVAAYVPDDLDGVLCGYHLAQIRPSAGRTYGEYLFRSFCSRGINDQFRVEATGVTRFGLGKYALDNALFVLPPLPEQRAIAAFLDQETARIDGLINKVNESIALLSEYRTALISAAVTGKIDVRVDKK